MINRNELAVIVANVIKLQGTIDITCYGNDMFPLIREGNMSTFGRVREEELQIGDVCLFANNEGCLLLYRLIEIEVDGQQPAQYIFRGDACDKPEQPVTFSRIIGKLAAIHREGKIVYTNHWKSRLLETAVLQVPFWSKLSRWAALRRKDGTSTT
ncbi:hypothetical protein [Paenibacillus harenae]|uniref:hypothetical protein n=1 Tax=Paenibacillus harenae TaxID=306543 RepID=UPI000423539A|nr:hypothetical protein [Paenibacillus harenae]